MRSLGISVIVVALEPVAHLNEAIQCVLGQTHQDLEIVVVGNVGSEYLRDSFGFNDPRITHVIDANGQGFAAAVNQGVHESSGEVIAFLDANDSYHPGKLEEHIAFLEKHPEVGATCDWCFDVDETGALVSFSNCPRFPSLSDTVLESPPDFSTMVLRRDWVFQVGLFDEAQESSSYYLDFIIRLFLAGCCFAGLEKGLTYLRRQPFSYSKCLTARMESRLATLERMFADPRCPHELLAVREKAYARTYLEWSYMAFAQNDTPLGQEAIRNSIQLDRSILDMQASRYLEFLILRSIQDGQEHESRLRGIFEQLPPELAWITQYDNRAVARGFLYRGVRAIMWGRIDQGRECLAKASALGMELNRAMYYQLIDQLLGYETLLGVLAAEEVLHNLVDWLGRLGKRADKRWFTAVFLINQAFRVYQSGDYAMVPNKVLRSIWANPVHMSNWGVWTILIRSLISAHWNQGR